MYDLPTLTNGGILPVILALFVMWFLWSTRSNNESGNK